MKPDSLLSWDFLCSQLPSGMLSFSQLCHFVALKFENSLWKGKFLPQKAFFTMICREHTSLRFSSRNQKWATGSHDYTWLNQSVTIHLTLCASFLKYNVAFWIGHIPPRKQGIELHGGSGRRTGHLNAKAVLQIADCLEHLFPVWRVQAAPHLSKVSSMYRFKARLLPMDVNFHIDSTEPVIFPTRLGSHTCNLAMLRFQVVFPLCLCSLGSGQSQGQGTKL